MRLIIDRSEYNVEYIKNAYGVPQDINMVIAEAIINGKQIPTPHGRLIDADALWKDITTNIEDCAYILGQIMKQLTIIDAEGSVYEKQD